MTKAGERLIGAAKEALAVARGEIPAARLHVGGHAYVPVSALTLQQLHDAEIPGSISWLPDGAWEVTIGNPVRSRDIVKSEKAALEWLRIAAKVFYKWEPTTSAEPQ